MKKITVVLIILLFFWVPYSHASVDKSVPKPVIDVEIEINFIKNVLIIEHYLKLIEKLKSEGD